jgi:DNA-binding CsgD family transcriptional regulator
VSKVSGQSAVSSDPVARALDTNPYAALVLKIPSELIVAASPSAASLLDPSGGAVVGHVLDEFTADRATVGPDLFAGGRLNGFEAFRVLRRAGGTNQRVRMWIRSFADHPSSQYVLVIIVADQDRTPRERAIQRQDAPAVVGIAGASLLVERISSEAESLFGWPVADLLGTSLIELIAEDDVPNCLNALGEASASHNGINLYLDVRRNGEIAPGETGSVGCEVLILPLHPSPSCAFVFLPTPVELSRSQVSGDLSAILLRLGRGAEIAQLIRGATAGLTDRHMPGLSQLTTRELEILTRLLDGDRAPAIAADLFLTQGTVRNHLASIFAKVGVTSQQQLLNLFRAARTARP